MSDEVAVPAPRSEAEVILVPFHGDQIPTVNVGGQPHIVFKPVVEGIGLDYWPQVEKMRGRSWAALGKRQVQLPDQAQRREMLTCDVRTFLMWLATVDENRVSEDVRETLVTYQKEVAAAVDSYWNDGAAINPRATEDQLSAVISLSRQRLDLLQAAAGLVDPAWLEAKTRHELARGFGEVPELDRTTRPLTVGEYLQEQGVHGAELRSMSSMFGKLVKKRYRIEYRTDPLPTERFVDGALRSVAGYTEQHRSLFDATWNAMTGGGAA